MKSHDDYRLGVGLVLLNQLNQVFIAKRIDTPNAWQMPQGGIEKDEVPRETVMRELVEEIGTDQAEIIAESKDWLVYDLPKKIRKKTWEGKYVGQKQKWFALRFTGTNSDIDLTADKHPEFSEWKWTSMDQIVKLIVPFKRTLYKNIIREFGYLAK